MPQFCRWIFHEKCSHLGCLWQEISWFDGDRICSWDIRGIYWWSMEGSPKDAYVGEQNSNNYVMVYDKDITKKIFMGSQNQQPQNCGFRNSHCINQILWLVGGNWLPWILTFPINIKGFDYHPNWRSPSFFRTGWLKTTSQMDSQRGSLTKEWWMPKTHHGFHVWVAGCRRWSPWMDLHQVIQKLFKIRWALGLWSPWKYYDHLNYVFFFWFMVFMLGDPKYEGFRKTWWLNP